MTEQTKPIGSNASHSAPSDASTTNYAMRVFYALAILFVVAGHSSINYPSGFNFGYNLFPVYAFHMPMFIFASGYFYNHRHERHPLRFVIGKAKRLIVPMYAIHALMGVFVMILVAMGFSAYDGIALNMKTLLVDPWLHFNMHEFEYDLATWFVIPMFLAQCSYMALHALVVHGAENGKVRMVLESVLMAMLVVGGMLLMGAVGAGEANEAAKESDWLRLYQTGCFLPFVAIGHYYRAYLEKLADKVPDLLALVLLALVQLCLLFAYGDNLTMIICWVSFPAGAVGTILMGMVGTLFWLRISKILSLKLKDSWLTNEIGKNTFSIMAFHFVGFFALNCLLYAVLRGSDGHRLATFSVEAFKAGGVYYKCVPGSMLSSSMADAWGMLYVLSGIAVPLALHRAWAWASGLAMSWWKRRSLAPLGRWGIGGSPVTNDGRHGEHPDGTSPQGERTSHRGSMGLPVGTTPPVFATLSKDEDSDGLPCDSRPLDAHGNGVTPKNPARMLIRQQTQLRRGVDL